MRFQHRGRLCRIDILAAAMTISIFSYLKNHLQAESALRQAKALHSNEWDTDNPEAADPMKECSQTCGSATPAYRGVDKGHDVAARRLMATGLVTHEASIQQSSSTRQLYPGRDGAINSKAQSEIQAESYDVVLRSLRPHASTCICPDFTNPRRLKNWCKHLRYAALLAQLSPASVATTVSEVFVQRQEALPQRLCKLKSKRLTLASEVA